MKMIFGLLIGVIAGGLLLAGVLSAVLTGAQSESCETGLPPDISAVQEEEQEIQEGQSEDGNTAKVVVSCRPGGMETPP